jgi:hypothetical protein
MIHVPITLSKNVTLNDRLQPVNISIPFENGKIFNVNNLVLVNEKQQFIDIQIRTLAFWPNNSLKWLQVSFLIKGSAKSETTIYLTDTFTKSNCTSTLISNENLTSNSIQIEKTPKFFSISTGVAKFQMNRHELGIFSANSTSNENIKLPLYKSEKNSLVLTDKKGITYFPIITKIRFNSQDHKNKKILQLTAYVSGSFQTKENTSVIKFYAEIKFYLNEAYTHWNFTLHNSNSMVQSGGTWDLGNENSLYFKSFNARISCQNNKCTYKIMANTKCTSDSSSLWHESNDGLTIFQASSGGEHWQSNNHVNNQGVVPIEFNGFRILSQKTDTTIKELTSETIIGRASPFINIPKLGNITSGLSVHIKNFWQKFPKSIVVNKNTVVLGLFPEQALDGFELQPGEKKNDTFYISYDDNKGALDHIEFPIRASLSSEYLAQTKTVPFFTSINNETDYNNIINDGIESANNFFQKRELIDEFGWRNFGDLYADHETLECDGDDELISHYNNQYDPLYGLLRQYLLTNNPQWFILASDLADHVKNIDIYHTDSDKAEYNGGLFWHTDHYLPAETASHRTYSNLQRNDAYQDHTGGGGPGGQHCYTNGLMLHYFLTGEETSKQAVLQLTKWITHVYEGSGTLTDFLLAIKNNSRLDVKNIFTGKYPFDRGTGHYITALIDSFELTGKQSYLDQASLIIKNTVHPEDDIKARNLNNVEECWFYTVFLQAIYRYLLVKENNQQLDASFHYVNASLQHYAKWMCEYEQPYLDNPEILEYPNHTWAAQDIRKANVLYMASYFANNKENKIKYKRKADTIYHYVTEKFSNEPTRSFTRILSILMQNHGVKSYVENTEELFFSPKYTFKNPDKNFSSSEKHNITINKPLFGAFIMTLSNTSLTKELTWLRKRIVKIDSFLNSIGK